jgi:NADH-quinone oxidoreductase subunit F
VSALEIRVGVGSCGVASGAEPVRAALERAAAEAGVKNAIKAVGCNGMCHREPIVEVVDSGGRSLYGNVTPEAAERIARRHIRPRTLWNRVRWSGKRLNDSPEFDRPSRAFLDR